jgi:hypothetical protein
VLAAKPICHHEGSHILVQHTSVKVLFTLYLTVMDRFSFSSQTCVTSNKYVVQCMPQCYKLHEQWDVTSNSCWIKECSCVTESSAHNHSCLRDIFTLGSRLSIFPCQGSKFILYLLCDPHIPSFRCTVKLISGVSSLQLLHHVLFQFCLVMFISSLHLFFV